MTLRATPKKNTLPLSRATTAHLTADADGPMPAAQTRDQLSDPASRARFAAVPQVAALIEALGHGNITRHRDQALIAVLYTTGLTLTEMSRLTVGMVFANRGKRAVKPHIDLDQRTAFNAVPRRVYLVHSWVEALLMRYAAWRETSFPYQCTHGRLDADEPLFVDENGLGFDAKVSRDGKNGREYRTPIVLSVLIRDLHRRGGMESGDADSARRSHSIWLANGDFTGTPMHIDWIRQLRGDKRLSTTQKAIGRGRRENLDPLLETFKKVPSLSA